MVRASAAAAPDNSTCAGSGLDSELLELEDEEPLFFFELRDRLRDFFSFSFSLDFSSFDSFSFGFLSLDLDLLSLDLLSLDLLSLDFLSLDLLSLDLLSLDLLSFDLLSLDRLSLDLLSLDLLSRPRDRLSLAGERSRDFLARLLRSRSRLLPDGERALLSLSLEPLRGIFSSTAQLKCPAAHAVPKAAPY